MSAITDYWHEHYTTSGLCDLCDNSGYIVASHGRMFCNKAHYCICPNGQLLRKHKAKLPWPPQNV
jgi:hypothetical protein